MGDDNIKSNKCSRTKLAVVAFIVICFLLLLIASLVACVLYNQTHPSNHLGSVHVSSESSLAIEQLRSESTAQMQNMSEKLEQMLSKQEEQSKEIEMLQEERRTCSENIKTLLSMTQSTKDSVETIAKSNTASETYVSTIASKTDTIVEKIQSVEASLTEKLNVISQNMNGISQTISAAIQNTNSSLQAGFVAEGLIRNTSSLLHSAIADIDKITRNVITVFETNSQNHEAIQNILGTLNHTGNMLINITEQNNELIEESILTINTSHEVLISEIDDAKTTAMNWFNITSNHQNDLIANNTQLLVAVQTSLNVINHTNSVLINKTQHNRELIAESIANTEMLESEINAASQKVMNELSKARDHQIQNTTRLLNESMTTIRQSLQQQSNNMISQVKKTLVTMNQTNTKWFAENKRNMQNMQTMLIGFRYNNTKLHETNSVKGLSAHTTMILLLVTIALFTSKLVL